jgi:small subunit ribosomal protein S21
LNIKKTIIFAALLKKHKENNMIIVQIKEGENLEKSLKAFKKKFDRIGIVKELRARKVYNKPSIIRRQKKLKAVLRQKYIDSLE